MFNSELMHRIDSLESRIRMVECKTEIYIESEESSNHVVSIATVLFYILKHFKLKIKNHPSQIILEKDNEA